MKGPLLPAPTTSGDWTDRCLDNSEIGRWFKAVWGALAKATLLSMLAKFGAGSYDRLILGHHSTKSLGAVEAYSRDLQAGT